MLQVAVAAAIGVTVFAVAIWAIRMLATPVPTEPDPDEIEDVEVPYRCTVCGLRLVVTHAQEGEQKAPRHCREEMVPA